MGTVGSKGLSLASVPGGAQRERANSGESGIRRATAYPRRVLLVEDEDMVRKVVARMLTARGFEVQAAGSCAEAMSLFAARSESGFDLLVTDLMMPDGAGLVVARRFSEELPELKVLFVSGYSSVDTNGWEPERFRFLTKPFGSADLARVIDDLFDVVPANLQQG